jgi:hypothetical protein
MSVYAPSKKYHKTGILKFYMKKISIFLALSFAIVLILASCSDSVTYAEQLKAEKELIADYIKRNNIKVVTTMPEKWDDNVYYKSESGLYFHLISQGDVTGDTLVKNDEVIARYYRYTLDSEPDTLDRWSTVNYPYPETYNYKDYTQACTGWHEAFSYMKYNYSRAKIIVYSKIGFTEASESVTPYCYEMRIQFQK